MKFNRLTLGSLLCAMHLVLVPSFGQQLSQNSNYYLYKSSSNQFFISSLDGLNIYDGKNNKVYRPSAGLNMRGKNIQSRFYEDKENNIWFTTYEALHVYNPSKDDLNYFQFKDTIGVDIKTDYRIIHQVGDTIWVQAGSFTVLYNTHLRETIRKFRSDLNEYYAFYVQVIGPELFQIIAGSAIGEGIKVVTFNEDYEVVSVQEVDATYIYSLKRVNECKLIATSFNGKVLLYDHCRFETDFHDFVDTSDIYDVEVLSEEEFVFYTSRSGIFEYSLKTGNKTRVLYDPVKNNLHDKNIVSCYPIGNNHYMFGAVGEGIKSSIPRVEGMFESEMDEKFNQISISYCIPMAPDRILIFCHDNSIYLYEIENNLRKKLDLFKGGVDGVTRTERGLIISFDSSLYVYNLDKPLTKLYRKEGNKSSRILNLFNLNGQIYSITNNYDIAEIEISNDSFQVNYVKHEALDGLNVTSVSKIDEMSALLSINNEFLMKMDRSSSGALTFNHKYEITGELKDVVMLEDSIVFVASSNGLYEIRLGTNFMAKRKANFGNLDVVIYSIIPDENGFLWMSSNSGIFKYDPRNNDLHPFRIKDGVQGLEYNTNAFTQTNDGYIVFGGTKGLDYFHPDSIVLSDYKTPIYFSSLSVNNKPYLERAANFIDTLVLPFTSNSLTFGFHAIEYPNSKNTLTRYKLEGEDGKYSKPTSDDGVARYSNLDPGDYIFMVQGANSDHVWNPEPRKIYITILPPWYATWWARSLGVFFMSGLLYFIFWSYYKRQLREKDLALREASLTISKQEALAQERTRIAAEMHDDLGGGLTRIRFLSQKVLRTVTNDDLKSQVDKIVGLSEGLVRNMGEIIWAMDSGYDTVNSLISYTRRFAFEYLEDYDIDLNFNVEGKTTGLKLTGQQRRNVFLVIKEALHNAVKHSNSKKVEIHFAMNGNLDVKIKDDGIGINKEAVSGNGLGNMRKRMEALNGSFHLEAQDGTKIEISIPLNSEN